MSLRYAILGFLSTTPATGYELKREFQIAVGWSWEALPSQIYPELRAIEALGWIKGELSPGGRPNRRTYRLTRRGEQELRKWIEADNDYPPVRDAERIRLIYLDKSPRAAVRRHLEHHRRHFERQLAVWRSQRDTVKDRTHPRLDKRLAGRREGEHAYIIGLKQLAFDGNIRRAELEIAWSEDALAWLDALEAKAEPTRPARRPQRKSAGSAAKRTPAQSSLKPGRSRS
jgi:PadR family transcriptional regulator AphA